MTRARPVRVSSSTTSYALRGLAATPMTRVPCTARSARPLGPGPGRVDELAGRPGRGCRARWRPGRGRPRSVRSPAGGTSAGRSSTAARRTPPPRRAQRSAERAAALEVLDAGAVEVPPARAVGERRAASRPAPSRPGRSTPRGRRATDLTPGERAVGHDLGEHHLRAVPGHPRVVPGDPGGVPPVGREPRPGDEAVPVVGELPYRGAVLGGGAVQGDGGDDPPYVGRPLAGELLQHAPDFTAVQVHLRVDPAQSAADRRERA